MADEFLYGTKAIAKYMGLYHRTVSRWIRDRGLPATFQGRSYITTRQVIDAWLAIAIKAEAALGKNNVTQKSPFSKL